MLCFNKMNKIIKIVISTWITIVLNLFLSIYLVYTCYCVYKHLYINPFLILLPSLIIWNILIVLIVIYNIKKKRNVGKSILFSIQFVLNIYWWIAFNSAGSFESCDSPGVSKIIIWVNWILRIPPSEFGGG